jgi:hypothetical protein
VADWFVGPPWRAGGSHCAVSGCPPLSRASASLRSRRDGLTAALDSDSWVRLVVVFGVEVCEGGAQEPVDPLLGQCAGVAEHMDTLG